MFVLKDDKTLVVMKPANFAAESDFQRLLADFPALLAGAEIDRESPRQWVLVKREKSVPSENDSGGRWFVDHLFLDQDGIPTLVEVKRQSDTRIRREVIGQMLDYAANGIEYWPLAEIRSQFEATCKASNVDPLERLAQLLGASPEEVDTLSEEFWTRVHTNLKKGKIRMLFVADLIPRELRRVVEFLNEQMDTAEVLALELRQYQGEGGLKTLVPRLYGQTEEAQQRKATTDEKKQWDEDSFYEEIRRRYGPELVDVARKIHGWMETNADKTWYGTGKINGGIGTAFICNGAELYPLYLYTDGRVSLTIGWCNKGPFESVEKRLEWIRRLNGVDGIKIPESRERPSLCPVVSLQGRASSQSLLGSNGLVCVGAADILQLSVISSARSYRVSPYTLVMKVDNAMSFVTYNYIAVMGSRSEVLRFKKDARRSVKPSQRSPGFSRIDFSIVKLFKTHRLTDPTGQGFPGEYYHYFAEGWRVATWHEFVRQLYSLEIRNYEVSPFLVPVSRVYRELCFVVSELSLDLGDISSAFVTRGRVSTWVLPDDRRSAHWENAARAHGYARVEDAYEDDNASNDAEFAMLDDGVHYWDKRVLRVLRARTCTT